MTVKLFGYNKGKFDKNSQNFTERLGKIHSQSIKLAGGTVFEICARITGICERIDGQSYPLAADRKMSKP